MLSTTSVDCLSSDESIDLEIFNSSLSEFRSRQLSGNGHPYDKVVVGAAILRYSTDAPRHPSLLLLQRAAYEHFFPNVFEIPGGKVDADDPSIKYALAREVTEETGLDIVEVISELKPMTYTTDKAVVDDGGREKTISKSVIQLNYVVHVSDGDVRLNADEHSKSCWVRAGQEDELNVTTAMRAVVKEAFEWAVNHAKD